MAPIIDELKSFAGSKIFHRGVQYYQDGLIEDYAVFVKDTLSGRRYSIEACVIGTAVYEVNVEILVENGQVRIDELYCTCPYDWGPVCKHEVAVLYKFFNENYRIIEKKPKSKGFNSYKAEQERINLFQYEKLKSIIDSERLPEVEFKYYIKGLLSDSMRNFRLTIDSDGLTESELNIIIDYILDGYAYGYGIKEIRDRISINDMAAIEYLCNTQTSKTRTPKSVLFPKTSGNFNFICKLIREGEVFFEETGERASVGETISLPLVISGDENEIVIDMKDIGYRIYGQYYADVAWTVIDNKLHKVNMRHRYNLPLVIPIPESKKGEFLFKIIPELKQKLNAEINIKTPDYRLIVREPEIRLDFDYMDGVITCQAEAVIDNKTVTGIELLNPELSEDSYSRSEEDELLWYKDDMEQLRKLINFLEENEFMLTNQRFVIKNHSDIQNFITDGFLRIPEEWEVKTSDAFKELEVVPVKLEPKIELDTEGIDWFEFKITYNLGGKTYTRKQLLKMLKTNRRGEKYLHVGNSYFVVQSDGSEDDIIERVLDMAEEKKDGSYRSRFFNLMYYNDLFARMGIEIKGDGIYNQLKEDISRQKLVESVDVPEEVKNVLRKYQLQGYYWLKFLNKYRFGGILADDMGLGKTIQALTLLKSVSNNKPSLVVCPRTLIYNWAGEIEKFFPKTKYLVYHGSPDERAEMRKKFNEHEIIITSYDTVSRDINKLSKFGFNYCVLDEAQHIKNHKTRRSKNLKKINADYRLALTGTPLENSVSELWSVFDFLMSGYLGSYNEFSRRYLTPINKKNDKSKLVELKQRVAPFILRRTKNEVLRELPEKVELINKVYMTKLQEDTYKTILEQVRTDLFKTINEKGFEKARINVLAALTKLRMACNHPRLVLNSVDEKTTSGKIEGLMEIVEETIAGGHKIIIFSQFVKMLKIIEEQFKQTGLKYEYLDGSTRNRMERVRRFNEDETVKAFLISLKAGGTGLNLTSADIVIHVDPWWNPMVERQATDRAHRIGQEKKVMVYKLITAGSIEEKMLKLQEKKNNLFKAVVENNQNQVFNLTWEDIKELFEWEKPKIAN
ncbi:MAG: hypothetical protein PWQ82_1308 [Thermosediminibacterales bacterium]|nr:hypothetical protein [Thermosediminibacterales bacterium]